MSSKSYFCKVESFNAVKDYQRGGRCVRLIGISGSAYHQLANPTIPSEGLTTYTIDVGLWSFLVHLEGLKHWRQVTSKVVEKYQEEGGVELQGRTWLCLTITSALKGDGYLYSTFGEEEPAFFTLSGIKIVKSGAALPAMRSQPRAVGNSRVSLDDFLPPTTGGKGNSAPAPSQFRFVAFHVGQGMCSVVHNRRDGIVLDIGAGVPITRPAYLAGRIPNELSHLLLSLQRVALVISHADADHWRIIAWDARILEKLGRIFVPDGDASLAFEDKALIGRITPISGCEVALDYETTLKILRSNPPKRDRNGECLLSLFARGEDRVLAAGDYVYERIGCDFSDDVRATLKCSYAAVIVPHHGDTASSKLIPNANSKSSAFFSAGKHKGYRHPTAASIAAHEAAGYKIVRDEENRAIEGVQLV